MYGPGLGGKFPDNPYFSLTGELSLDQFFETHTGVIQPGEADAQTARGSLPLKYRRHYGAPLMPVN